MTSASPLPQAVTAACPDCGDETPHRVLHGRMGTRGGLTLDATVQCDECGRVHHVVLREAPDVEFPVVVSTGPTSARTKLVLPGDEVVRVGDELIVDDRAVQVTGIERKDGLRRDRAVVSDVGTLWARDFESLRIRVGINLRGRTIVKEIQAHPEREFTLGQELMFGRLRVTVHAVKTKERMLRRGSAPAREIVKVFAKPTRGATLRETPPPAEGTPEAEQMRTATDVEATEEDAWDEVFDAEDEEE